MPELAEGQSIEIQGSATRPYTLKNVGGVYSCNCPAWRHQSQPIDRRTCKHLRGYRGEEAETARVGETRALARVRSSPKAVSPPLLLAETWTEGVDPVGWYLSEKLDGVRTYWDGSKFLSRNGNVYFAPEWFTTDLPRVALDGELWVDRKQFSATVSIVRRQHGGDAWRQVRFLVFDAPQVQEPFEVRLRHLQDLFKQDKPSFASMLDQTVCRDRQHLTSELSRIEGLGGEGVMLRMPGSRYVANRSKTLLKVKSFRDLEATVIAHQPGAGRHRGRLGALVVRLPNGAECAVGSGLSDAEREQPPAMGSVITLKYQELTDAGVPRFPVFVRVRTDELFPRTTLSKGQEFMSNNSKTRRFEFIHGSSCKFWEVCPEGIEVVVRFGRIGTSGQKIRKTFPNAALAGQHVEQLISQKRAKGYVPVAA